MQEIMEHYGLTLLAVLEVLGAFGIIMEGLISEGGMQNFVLSYMQSICG